MRGGRITCRQGAGVAGSRLLPWACCCNPRITTKEQQRAPARSLSGFQRLEPVGAVVLSLVATCWSSELFECVVERTMFRRDVDGLRFC